MAFITPESGFCLSPEGASVFPTCGEIIEESGKQYIWTEKGRELLIDGGCSDPAIPSFNCQVDRKLADSGSFVTIVNTCTLPITITGFKNSDAARFSIFQYPEYIGQGLYESGNTSQLPITLRPFEQTNIPTFFHPLRSELEHGTAGTFDVRDGDKFGATIDIYPGFPILNCTSSDTECDASFTLTGEFICEKPADSSILASNENFTAPDLTTISKIENTFCLPRTEIIELNTQDEISVENIYSGLSGLSLFYEATLNAISPSWAVKYPNMGVSGALGTFYHLVTGVMGGGAADSINNLLESSANNYPVTSPIGGPVGRTVSGSYSANNYTTFVSGGYTYTGMFFRMEPGDNGGLTSNQILLFNGQIIPGAAKDVRMFIVQSGDLTSDKLCGG